MSDHLFTIVQRPGQKEWIDVFLWIITTHFLFPYKMACIRIKQLSIGITCDFKRASMKTIYKAIDLNLYMNEETNKRIDVNAGKQTDRATTIWNRLRSSATYIFVSFYVWFGKFIFFLVTWMLIQKFSLRSLFMICSWKTDSELSFLFSCIQIAFASG